LALGSVVEAPSAGVVATLVLLLTGAVVAVVVAVLEALALAVVVEAVVAVAVAEAVEAVLRCASRATNAARHVSGICSPSSTPTLVTLPLLPTIVQLVPWLPSVLALVLQPMYL